MFSRTAKRIAAQAALVVGIAILVLFVIKPLVERRPAAVPGVVLTDLHSVVELQTRFNRDVGTPRLILLLSPT